MSAWIEKPLRFSTRYGARHPWLAPWPRAGFYLVWRGIVAGLRPTLFLLLLGSALWFSNQVLRGLPQVAVAPLTLQEQVDQALFDATPAGADRHAFWVSEIEASLSAPAGGVPDIERARVFAGSYVSIRGREALALELLSSGRRAGRVEAQLRALPAWERVQRIDAVLAEPLEQGEAFGYRPPELVFAPPSLRSRLARAEALFGPALRDAEAWFIDPRGRALSLQAAPGLSSAQDHLYGDVRGALVHGCALAGVPGRRFGQCRVGFLPKPQEDPILAGLALAVAGAEPERRVGARIAKAAWAAGRLDRRLATRLALGPDPELGREAVLASLMPILSEAGTAWTQPARYEDVLRHAALEAQDSARIDVDARDRFFDALAAMRRQIGALSSVRIADGVRSIEHAESLALLVETAGPRIVALHALSGAQGVAAIERGAEGPALDWNFMDWPWARQRDFGLAVASVLAAVLLLGLTLNSGFRRRRGGAPGVFERFDATMSRLILGRNL